MRASPGGKVAKNGNGVVVVTVVVAIDVTSVQSCVNEAVDGPRKVTTFVGTQVKPTIIGAEPVHEVVRVVLGVEKVKEVCCGQLKVVWLTIRGNVMVVTRGPEADIVVAR
jgi:hypothetical protein